MRSFKSKVLAACAWAAPLLSSASPLKTRHADVARPDGNILELDVQHNYAQATFSVPCAGCLGQHHPSPDDESIILRFATHANDQPCGVSNITLNGVYLPQEWKGDIATGSGSYTGVTDVQENAWFLQHDLDLEWETACIQGENEADDAAQVLTLNIKAVDGRPLDRSTGFTVSFKQDHSPPELLRLSTVPDPSARDKQHAQSWLEPPAHLRLALPPNPEGIEGLDFPVPASLEDEIRELRALQAELEQLQKVIHRKQLHIESQTNQAAENFKEKLEQCDSITCVFKTITSSAHKVWRVLYVQFRPNNHHRLPPPHRMGRPPNADFHGWMTSHYKQVPEGGPKAEAVAQVSRPVPPQGLPPPPPPPPHHPPPPPFPPHGFPPPPLPPHPPHLPHPPHPPHGPPPPFPYGPPPPPPPHGGPPPPPPNHRGPPRMPRPNSPFVVALEVVVGLLCCGCIVAVVRNRCSSLRSRTDRATLREERRNARAYRRAARQHAWRNWWRGNWRDRARIEDYEEKRALIQEQEDVLEDAMQEEIRQLRAAHGIVNDLVGAEEGRLLHYPHPHPHCSSSSSSSTRRHTPQLHCHCTHLPPQSHSQPQSPYSPLSTTSTYPPTSVAELPSRPLSRTDSLPGYASSSPPAYEEDEDVSDSVPNGFRNYAPSTGSSSSAASSRWTPDSSVVDVSPRPSAETLRYAEVPEGAFAEMNGEGTGVGEKN